MAKYTAYVKFSEMNNPKQENVLFCIIGETENDILSKALKYGRDPAIVSRLSTLNKDWV